MGGGGAVAKACFRGGGSGPRGGGGRRGGSRPRPQSLELSPAYGEEGVSWFYLINQWEKKGTGGKEPEKAPQDPFFFSAQPHVGTQEDLSGLLGVPGYPPSQLHEFDHAAITI